MVKMKLLNFLGIFFVVTFVSCNKYMENVSKKEIDSPFRMMKVNLLWNKAKMRLNKDQLEDLYVELKHQDGLEVELKKRRSAGQDEEGEYESIVRRKSLDILMRYGLETIDPQAPPVVDNMVPDAASSKHWEKVMNDKRLSKLWKKAQLAGFSDSQLNALKQEFLHHVEKSEEMNILHAGLDDLKKFHDNSIAGMQNKKLKDQAKEDLKNRHRQLKEGMMKIEEQIRGGADRISLAGGFKHPKVIELWFQAKESNFTEDEFASFQEELHHFEHKLMKLDHLQEEHQSIDKKMQLKNLQLTDYPDKVNKFSDKIKDLDRKIKKYETDLKDRVRKASRHNEL